MAITPQTNLTLLKSSLELSDDNQLTFTSKTEQFNYFNSLPKIEEEKFSYQRKDNTIRFPAHIDTILGYNYVMYQNSNYGNKWFYAFIEDMQYLNDYVTLIKIKTDVWQTWQFDLNFGMSWIEREHTNDDSIGSNLIEENLEIGEYVINNSANLDYNGYGQFKAPFVAIGVSQKFDTFNGVSMIKPFTNNMGKIDGLVTGLTYLIVLNSYDVVHEIISMYDDNSKSDAIVNIFPIPYGYLHDSSTLDFATYTYNNSQTRLVYFFTSSDDAKLIGNITSYAPSTLDGYTPKNKKLLTFPYCFEKASNNGGMDVVYRWEDFKNRQATFHAYATLTPGMSIKLIPIDYLNSSSDEAYEYGLTGQKLPTCCWTTDFYLNWLNQQGQNLAIQTGVSVGQSLLGGITSTQSGNAFGLLSNTLSIVSTISNTLQKQHEAELVPHQARGNVNSGDVNFSFGRSCFTLMNMSIKAQFAKSIDDYFSMFGYKTLRTKIPNIYGRKYWNYVKTVSCNITGDVPEGDIAEIKNLFDRGITLWHDPSAFLNYNLTNSII